MIDDALFAKFDRIQDLPVSEEMLGAYLEGNLDDAESIVVNRAIDSCSKLSSLISEIPSVYEFESVGFDADLFSESQSLISNLEITQLAPSLLNDLPSDFSDFSPTIQSTIENAQIEQIREIEPHIFDSQNSASESFFSSDDSSSTDLHSLESTNNSESISDEDMFNPNFE